MFQVQVISQLFLLAERAKWSSWQVRSHIYFICIGDKRMQLHPSLDSLEKAKVMSEDGDKSSRRHSKKLILSFLFGCLYQPVWQKGALLLVREAHSKDGISIYEMWGQSEREKERNRFEERERESGREKESSRAERKKSLSSHLKSLRVWEKQEYHKDVHLCSSCCFTIRGGKAEGREGQGEIES